MSRCRFCGQIWPGAIRCIGCGAFMPKHNNTKKCNNFLEILQKKLKQILIKTKNPNEKD